jgi:glucosyl-3-phosphoglycerate synthase
VAQVDLLERVHHNQPLEALSKMSFAIIQAVIRKMEGRIGRPMLDEVNKSMKLIRYQAGDYRLEVEEIAERERPPMIEVPEYQEKRRAKAAVNRRSGEGQGAEGARSPSAPGSRRRRGG